MEIIMIHEATLYMYEIVELNNKLTRRDDDSFHRNRSRLINLYLRVCNNFFI